MQFAKRLVLGACGVAAALFAVRPAARAAELPRYKFHVGQELVYRTVDLPSEVRWTFNVVRWNSDGSWRLVFRQVQSHGADNPSTATGYFDLAPDGRLVENWTLTPVANPTALFPPLPPDEASLSSSWSATLPKDGSQHHMSLADQSGAGENECLLSDELETVLSPIYLAKVHYDFVFDRRRGLITRLTSTATQGWPERAAAAPQTRTISLDATRQLESGENAALDENFEAYFAGKHAYLELAKRAAHDFEHSAELMKQAFGELEQLRSRLKVPAVKELASATLDRHEQSLERMLEDGKHYGKYLNKPSANWKTTDLDGNPRSLEDYRGKVVLLDFWYRGCSWCVRAMPQIKQLVDDFSGQDFVALGINNDRDLDDARLVIDAMQLTYETLNDGRDSPGGAIHNKYGVHGWPTIVLLDADGVVRHVHVGYSLTLREQLSEKIKELLAEK